MSVFNDYAHYYNALYQDKDYAGETQFILECFHENGANPKSILDLGCGTGKHALEMAKCGISVHGVDMSNDMLNMGQEMMAKIDANNFPVPLPTFEQGDARSFRSHPTNGKDTKDERSAKDEEHTKFDAVTSLFHVMSYQNTEEDALAVFQTAKTHLKPKGFFLFDFWYGPCVLKERPEYREKLIKHEQGDILRVAKPELRVNENIVNVHYTMTLNQGTKTERNFGETHSMRYWFLPELRYLAKTTGFAVCNEGAWMSQHSPTENDWGVWMLVQI